MSEYTVQTDRLAVRDEELVEGLVEFLDGLFSEEGEVRREGNKVIVSFEEFYSKRKLKTYLKRFVYAHGLRDDFRVIAGIEDDFIIHTRKKYLYEL